MTCSPAGACLGAVVSSRLEGFDRRAPVLEYQLAGDIVLASHELPADPFVAHQPARVIDSLPGPLDELAVGLADRVGGTLFLDSLEESTDDDLG